MSFPSPLRSVASLLAAISLCASLSACQAREPSPAETTSVEAATTEPDVFYPRDPTPIPEILFYPAIPGDGHRIADDSMKADWEQPLAKLLSNVLIPYGKGGEILGYTASLDDNAPAVPESYACGLLDVTADGVPELLIYPLGGGGSAGNALYFIYDIHTGEKIGSLDGGHDKSWCYYYDTETDECRLYGQFWWRMGWAGRDRYVQKLVYRDQERPYVSDIYLHTSHTIDAVQELDEDGNSSWEEVYSNTNHYLNGKKVTMDDYYEEYDHFTTTCIRLPDTALVLFHWDDVAADDADYAEKGQKMAYALTHSEQVFLLP